MGLFSKILDKLGIDKEDSAHKAATDSRFSGVQSTSASAPAVASSGTIARVDINARMEELAAKNPQKLNWKTSIVDLLKLLDIDSSLQARKELAQELGAPADVMGGDSAKMNIWLHKQVLGKVQANGGNVPRELLD